MARKDDHLLKSSTSSSAFLKHFSPITTPSHAAMMTMEKQHHGLAGTSQPPPQSANHSNGLQNASTPSTLQLAKPSGVKGANENCYVTQSPSTLLESLPYYYGCISREGAEWILYDEGCPDGMYLLRESGTDLVLSLCHHSR